MLCNLKKKKEREMEKICEFCTSLRPVVYCKADAANLCLSCDARVHSANELSSRHIRTLLCELCKYRPAHVQCLDHRMFMCRGCDHSLHEVSSQHQKQVLTSYMGCPSSKDFAALWNLDLIESDSSALQDRFASTSFSSMDGGAVNFDFPRQSCPQAEGSTLASELNSTTSVLGAESQFGSTSVQSKVYYRGQYHQDTSNILQQVLDLKRLQLKGNKNNSSLIRREEQTDISSTTYDTSQKSDENVDQFSQHLHNIVTDQKLDSPQQEHKREPFPSPFSQLEQLSSSSTAGIPLNGDPFWQCKSPVQSSQQLWSQNMQDLGVCEEFDCFDDSNMPDVDLTFQNYEELFGGDQNPVRALLDEKESTCSSIENNTSFDRSDDASPIPLEGASAASSVHITSSAHVDGDICPNQAHNVCGSMDSPHLIQPSYSTLSFSLSRLSSESRGIDCLDSGDFSIIAGGQRAHSEARESAMIRYKEKKKVRMNEKKDRHLCQKARAGVGKRARGRSLKPEGFESDTM